jgi:hypothetical protein
MKKYIALYHGSNTIVKNPQIFSHNKFLDFGNGFYTTTNRRQAENFTKNVVKRSGGERIVNIYEFDVKNALSELKRLHFKTADKEWLEFVRQNRMGSYNGEQYDIISGPVADDRVFRTLVLYEDGTFSVEEVLKKLDTFKLYNQMVFMTPKGLSFLRFIEALKVKKGIKNG